MQNLFRMVISSTFPVRLFTVIGRTTCFGVFIVHEWQSVSNPEKERGRGDGPPVWRLKLFQQNIRTLLIKSMPSYCRADQVRSQSHPLNLLMMMAVALLVSCWYLISIAIVSRPSMCNSMQLPFQIRAAFIKVALPNSLMFSVSGSLVLAPLP